MILSNLFFSLMYLCVDDLLCDILDRVVCGLSHSPNACFLWSVNFDTETNHRECMLCTSGLVVEYCFYDCGHYHDCAARHRRVQILHAVRASSSSQENREGRATRTPHDEDRGQVCSPRWGQVVALLALTTGSALWRVGVECSNRDGR